MNKSEMINSLSEETTFSKKDVTKLLDSFFRIVQRALRKGDKVQLANFGTWRVTHRAARKGVNPATRQPIKIPELNIARFKPGKDLKEAVRSS